MPNRSIIALFYCAFLLLLTLWSVFYTVEPKSVLLDLKEIESVESDLPDFSKFTQVVDKKRAFFDYLGPIVDKQNEQFLFFRQQIQGWRAKYIDGQALTSQQQEQLNTLQDEYRVETTDPLTIFDELLTKIDEIPRSLVLVQAANESAWGTSRFAVDGYNFYGLWCFIEGCGFVPNRRNDGAIHEVAKFSNASQATYSYMRNINRHQAYEQLRAMRANLRRQNKPLNAHELAEGLLNYSERRHEYVQELQQMIRVNKEFLKQ